MKFGYAIVLVLVALVAVTGFASADRLPQQVPENQIFTIDTLIDVTGAVSEESEMQWTIDSMNIEADGYYYDDANQDFADAYVLTDDAGGLTGAEKSAALLAWGTSMVNKYGGVLSDYVGVYNDGEDEPTYSIAALYVPATEPTTILWGGYTLDNLLTALAGDGDYVADDWTASGHIHDSQLLPTEEIAILTWTDSLRSNGGKLSLNKNIDFDSQNKGNGLSNLEVEKVLTYASTEGAHLVGSEEWTLDVAGSWEATADTIRCVFAEAGSDTFPAFCNVVKAKSELVNINSAQISTKGSARAVAATGDIPAALSYQIAVTPDSNSGSGFADGTVKTLFGGSIMEARGRHTIPSATNNWKDSASVTGGIKNFQKTFTYESGFKF